MEGWTVTDTDDTVNYRAKSPLASKTIVTNIIALAVMVLGSDQLKSMLGPNALEIVGSILTMLNIGLRFVTVRPVAASLLLSPAASKPVAVKKLS
jgi:hypothetical protein